MMNQRADMKLFRTSSIRSTCSTASSSSSSSAKSVRFGRVSARPVVVDECEIGDMWYTDDDLILIRKNNRAIVNKAIAADETNESWRGLEQRVDDSRRRQLKMKIQLILNKQVHDHSPEDISHFAASLSRSDSRRSVLTAVRDANEAKEIYKDSTEPKAVIIYEV